MGGRYANAGTYQLGLIEIIVLYLIGMIWPISGYRCGHENPVRLAAATSWRSRSYVAAVPSDRINRPIPNRQRLGFHH